MPSDVQSALDNNKLRNEYEKMLALINDMASSIKSLEDKKPIPKIEGYKVIGTSFFKLEIPEDWDVKTTEDYALRWEIYSKEDLVGDIELLPYKSLYDSSYTETDLNKLLVDDEHQRKAIVYLNNEDGYKEVMQNIKLTFEFVPSPFTVLDLESASVEYINGGGKKLFGQIEDIKIVKGVPKSITIRAMEFISDDTSDSGFYIKDLGFKEEYFLDNQVILAPLMPPNYNRLGAYSMFTMDNDFIQAYENLYSMNYNFIIGADNQLKIIMGLYIP